MNKHLLPVILGMALIASSCKKDKVTQDDVSPTLTEIVVPADFSWQTTRNVNFSIGISDARFQNQIHVVAIYLADPASGATPISKGAATLVSPFNAKLSIPAGIHEVYVVKSAPDATSTTEKVAVTSEKVSVAMSAVKSTEKLASVSIPNKVMATSTEPNCKTTLLSGDINVNNNTDVVCFTPSSNQTINITANNGGTVNIIAPGKTITIVNYNHNGLNLLISEGTTIKFNNSLDIRSSETITNNGSIQVNDLTISGTLANNGTITVNGGTFNMNGTISKIINNGILSAANASINTNGLITNLGTIVLGSATFNSEASLINYCQFIVNGNMIVNTPNINNYKLMHIKGDTNVNSNGTITMFASAMYQTESLSNMNGQVIGKGVSPALFKVVGNVGDNVFNNNGFFNGSLQYCGTKDLDVNQNNKKHFGAAVLKSCVITIPKDDCNPLGAIPVIQDADGDGVIDLLDDYPADKNKAFKNYSVNYSNGGATIAFEDSWPKKGDFDLNDVVLNYKHLIITNKDNIVVRVEGEWNLLASGGDFQNGAGIQFPLTKASATNFVSSNSLTPEGGQDSLVVILFNNSRLEQATWNTRATEPASAAKKYTFGFDVTNGPSLLTMGASGYNPFIWNNTNGYGRGYETHLQGKKGTKLVNSQLFNTLDDKSAANNKTYSTVNQLPWAIEIPQASFAYPLELQDISKTYLKFSNWASSGGTASIDWYSNTAAGYREATKIFSGATASK